MSAQPRSLSQVINYIKGLIDTQLANKSFWLKVEISNISFHNSGHCYLDFVETQNSQTIAQCRATIWSSNIQSIRSELGTDFGNILKKGGEILCRVEVNFSTTYGLALNVFQVDKYYALGELERKKQQTLDKLKAAAITERNKMHVLPIVIQKVAVIGSPGTSGHTDFLKQLEKNEYGYKFYVQNYPCQVQGEKAEREILYRLDELQSSTFDVIVLIRGGGSKLDLEVFNSYEIAKKIALHTKPVLTGIGHETDVSIADFVANLHFKTPSALGAYLVSRNHNYEVQVQTTFSSVLNFYQVYMQRQKHRIKQGGTEFEALSTSYTRLRRGNLHTLGNRIMAVVNDKLARQKQFQQLSRQTILACATNSVQSRQTRLTEILTLLELHAKQGLKRKTEALPHHKELLLLYSRNKITKENDKLLNIGQLLSVYHPDNVLERGYSIIRHDGHVITANIAIRPKDTVEIELIDRSITASVVSVHSKKSKWKTLLTKVLQKS